MSFRQIFAYLLATLFIVAGAGLSNPARAGSLTYKIKVDTSGLAQGLGGFIQVTLGPNSPTGLPDWSARRVGSGL
jgi:hypothetical protein